MRQHPPLQLAIGYALFGAFWILATDSIVDTLFPEAARITAQTVKGLIYVSVTAALVYWLARRAWGRTERHVRELREAERRARRGEKRFRTVVEDAPDAIFVQRGGRFVYANPACRALLGAASEDELIGEQVLELFHEDDRKAVAERIRGLAEERRPAQLREEIMLTVSGEPVAVEVKATPVEYEGEAAALAFVRDIRERRAQAAARVRLRQAIEQSADAVVITDPEGNIQYTNAAFGILTGHAPESAVGEPLSSIREAGDPVGFERTWEKLRETGTWQGRVTNRRADGESVVCDVSITSIRDPDGEITGYVEIQRDVTRQVSLEEQLLRAQRLESVGRLAGGVAHDFNNMLTVIRGHTDLLLERDDLAAVRPDLENILEAANRSSGLVRQLLSFSRRQVVEPRVVELGDAVESRLEMLRHLIGEDIDLLWKPSERDTHVHIDPIQIDQILTNLVVNGRDAIRDVGQITVETARAEFDEEYCADHHGFLPGRYAMLAVSDSGIGMDAETANHIFEPFFTTKEADTGTGLGLSTVYGIVRQNEGFINVYSEPGEGTTFRIYFPLASADEEEHEPVVTPAPETGTERILVVEDEPALLEIAERFLSRLGYDVRGATTPGEAIELARQCEEPIHLLVTDVVLPEMNGLKLCEELLGVYPDLRCLFMSGYTADIITHRGILQPGMHFVQKPFTVQELGRKVREALADEDA